MSKDQARTLTEVKILNKQKGGHFFDRQTLKFFGETMKSFKVRNDGGKTFVIRKRDGKVWIFNPTDGDIKLYGEENREGKTHHEMRFHAIGSMRKMTCAHLFKRWTGSVPNTGRYLCTMCGKDFTLDGGKEDG